MNIVYSENIKNIFLDIERSKKSMLIEDYIGALSHLRRASGILVEEILMQSDILPYKYLNLSTFERLNIIKENGLADENELKLLHEIRQTGNIAVHKAEADLTSTESLIKSFQRLLHEWINKK